ncbi:MAG: glycosyltransferase [Prevotella sp.]|nr:glycosyltransferase [Prevotella sp.]
MKQLSILIPIHNVEKYVRDFFESISRQGLDDICHEIIIINDGSTDRSMDMIDDIIHQHDNITVITQENQGLSVTRNMGLERAKGEYVLFLDSDDLLIDGSLPVLLNKALVSRADMIVADFMKMNDEEIDHFHGYQQQDVEWKEKTGRQFFVEDLNPYQCYVWRTLFKRQFLIDNHIRFFPGINYQDIPFTHECYLKAGKCLVTSWKLNIYRRWEGSATIRFNLGKTKSFATAIAKTWELRGLEGLGKQEYKKLQDDVFTSFSTCLNLAHQHIHGFSNQMKVIDNISKLAPNLIFTNGIKQITTTIFYRISPHLFMALRFIRWKLCRILY